MYRAIESFMLNPRPRPRIAVRALLVALAATLAASVAGLDAHNAASRDNSGKLDAHLKPIVERGDDAAPQRVIVQVERDALGSVTALLKSRGDELIRYHAGIGAFTVRSTRLLELAEHPGVT